MSSVIDTNLQLNRIKDFRSLPSLFELHSVLSLMFSKMKEAEALCFGSGGS